MTATPIADLATREEINWAAMLRLARWDAQNEASVFFGDKERCIGHCMGLVQTLLQISRDNRLVKLGDCVDLVLTGLPLIDARERYASKEEQWRDIADKLAGMAQAATQTVHVTIYTTSRIREVLGSENWYRVVEKGEGPISPETSFHLLPLNWEGHPFMRETWLNHYRTLKEMLTDLKEEEIQEILADK